MWLGTWFNDYWCRFICLQFYLFLNNTGEQFFIFVFNFKLDISVKSCCLKIAIKTWKKMKKICCFQSLFSFIVWSSANEKKATAASSVSLVLCHTFSDLSKFNSLRSVEQFLRDLTWLFTFRLCLSDSLNVCFLKNHCACDARNSKAEFVLLHIFFVEK